jgi:type II secretory pathway component PulM
MVASILLGMTVMVLLSGFYLFFWLDPKETKDQGCRNCSAYAARPAHSGTVIIGLYSLY